MSTELPAGYADVLRILRAARNNGGAIYTLPTPGGALNWKQRAYKFRRLVQNIAQRNAPPGIIATTEWDDMVLRHKRGECNIVIEFGTIQGELSDLTGNPLSADRRVIEMLPSEPSHVASTDDPLLAEALELVREVEEKGND